VTDTASPVPSAYYKDRKENGGEHAEALADQTIASQEILIAARQEASKRGISSVPYLAALYLEYLDVREKAVAEYGEKPVQSLEDELLRAVDARVLIRPLKMKPNPMYA
jgi:hypothetical protein